VRAFARGESANATRVMAVLMRDSS